MEESVRVRCGERQQYLPMNFNFLITRTNKFIAMAVKKQKTLLVPSVENGLSSASTACQSMVAEKYMSGGSVNMSPPGAPISMYLSLGKLGGFGKVHGNHGSTELDGPPPGDPLGDKH